MEKPLLNEPGVFPGNSVLSEVLGSGFIGFESLMTAITDPEYALTVEWRYYRDGKAWLCKACYKKMTIFWLSVWQGYFKTAFYFMPRHADGVNDLDIDEEIKKDFRSRDSFGNLKPLVIKVTGKEQLKDVLEVIKYKKSMK